MNSGSKFPLNRTFDAEASPRLATVVWKMASEPGLKVSGPSTCVATQRSGWPNEIFPLQSPQEIKKRTRKMNVAKPRQVAMYLLRDLVHLSFPSIGRLFGLDHTTVLYSFEKITDGLVSDEKLNKQVLSIKSQLK